MAQYSAVQYSRVRSEGGWRVAPPLTSQLPVVAACHGEQSSVMTKAVDGFDKMTKDIYGNGKHEMSGKCYCAAQECPGSIGKILSPLTLSLLNLSQEGHTEFMEMDDF